MSKRNVFYFLFLFVVADIIFSFFQHLNMPLDGDVAGGIIPAEEVKKILNDPFGLSVLTHNDSYPNPNKFFCHWLFYTYFRTVPFLFQYFTDPINSVYLSCALIKTIVQISILSVLTLYICGNRKTIMQNLILVSALIVPLFQINGYEDYMGIIDKSITYTFFYALPLIFVMIFFLPFYRYWVYNEKLVFNWYMKFFWLLLSIVIPLSGPLNPAIVLIICTMFLINKLLVFFKGKFQMQKLYQESLLTWHANYLFLICILFFSCYSFYLSTFNSINISNQVSLVDLYIKLPEGLYFQFTQKLGFPLIIIILSINLFLLTRHRENEKAINLISVFKWCGVFILVYILLLPIGGYRGYRPYTLRYDTIMPVTLILFFMYVSSSWFLIQNSESKIKKAVLNMIAIVTFVFMNADKPEFGKNSCEKKSLKEISVSLMPVVKINKDCKVLSWGQITDPKDSELNAMLLNYWHITNEKRLYYQ